LLTDPDLMGHNLLGNLCKGLVASLCSHTPIVWYGACLGSVVWCLRDTAWLGSKFFGALTLLVVKVYNLCKV
jgi:hypothetical protein